MNWLAPTLGLLGLALLGILLYWQLVVAEGAYLGTRVVILLYNLTAHLYERIKQFRPGDEAWFLGLPLARALEAIPAPLVLDVATGTGRLPRAIARRPEFRGRVLALDLARRMLREAVRETAQFSDRITFFWQDARRLPFNDCTFDATACLEALEFIPDPQMVLLEMVRVLRPGGLLLVTNRIGRDAKLMPGRTFSRERFELILRQLPLERVRVLSWQMDYDLAWAVRTGGQQTGVARSLEDIMRCPACGKSVFREANAFLCSGCSRAYPIAEDGVIEMARLV